MNMRQINRKTTVSISLHAIPISFIFLCTALTGFASQTVLNIVILISCAFMLVQRTLFLAYPFMIFYAPLYGAVFGLSTYRLYSLIVLLELLLKLQKNSFTKAKNMIPVAVYVVYALLVVASYSVVDVAYVILNVICCVAITVGSLQDNPENIRKFFKIYVLVALVAVFTGLMGRNILIGNNPVSNSLHLTRFTATFEDPNYMGFFFTIGVFAAVTLKLFKPLCRCIIVIVLYAVIMSSASVTAVVVNILLWIVYLAVTRKINVKVGILGLVIIFLLIGLYQYGLQNPQMPIVGNISYRINGKLMDAESGDMSSVTTGRTDLAGAHFEYFLNLPLWKQLVGGTPVNASYISSEVYGAAHNEYIDMLLNIGLIGTMLMLWYIIQGVYSYIKVYRETKNNTQLCMLMCKCIWLAYAMTLTMFLEFRFMLPFFI